MNRFYKFLAASAVIISFMGNTISVNAEEKKWFDENRLVAHALGVVDSRIGTNSLEAFQKSYADGHRVMEADFSKTSDGTLVVRHDFEQDSYYTLEQTVLNQNTAMDLARYISEKICFKYTPLTAKNLIKLVEEHKDVYLITDTKDTDVESVKRDFALFVNDARELGMESILDRVIVQIYNEDMLGAVRSVYPFKNWIYTLYQTSNPDYNKIGDFCLINGIDVVTIDYSVLETDEIQKLNDRDIKVYTHTLNRILDIKKAVGMGCYGAYTDIIKPADLSFINLGMNKNTSKKIVYDKKVKSLEAYLMNDEKYVNIKELAELLNGSQGQFDVVIDDMLKTVTLAKGKEYSVSAIRNTENNGLGAIQKSNYTLNVGGTTIHIDGYTVDGNYYYRLKDLAAPLGFSIAWSGIYAMDEILLYQNSIENELVVK